MLVDSFPPNKRALAFAAYGVVVVAGPVVGPVIGGWITDNYSWHWCFLINVPVGALSLFLVHLFVDEPEALRRDRSKALEGGLKVDILGFLGVGGFLGFLEVTLDRGQREDWFSSPIIVTTAVLSGLCLLFAVPWELSRKDPIVPIHMFARRNFGIASIFLLITGLIIFGTTQFIPQLLQQVIGYTATNAGLALTAGGVATILMLPASGILSNKVDPRLLIGVSFVIQGLAMWNMSRLDSQLSFASAAWARVFQAVGLPFLFVPITNIAYVGLRPEESNQASALMNVARNLGGTFGISTVQTLLAQRSQWHQSHLVERLNPLNPVYANGITQLGQTLAAHGVPRAQAQQSAVGLLYRNLGQQAQMLSYIDVFRVLMWLVFAALPLLFLMQGKKPGQEAAR
jgi:DHA2 family multidrug resistance protein